VGGNTITFSVKIVTTPTTIEKIQSVYIFQKEGDAPTQYIKATIKDKDDATTNKAFTIILDSLDVEHIYENYIIEFSYGVNKEAKTLMPTFSIPKVEVNISAPIQKNQNTITMSMEIKTP